MLLNRGDGSFEAKRDYATGSGPESVAIGDLNGDGRPDLAIANTDVTSTVSVLLNCLASATDTAWAVAIQADGKIIAAGDGAVDPITSREPQKTKFELARYIGRR